MSLHRAASFCIGAHRPMTQVTQMTVLPAHAGSPERSTSSGWRAFRQETAPRRPLSVERLAVLVRRVASHAILGGPLAVSAWTDDEAGCSQS
jgi:hypothetical protein